MCYTVVKVGEDCKHGELTCIFILLKLMVLLPVVANGIHRLQSFCIRICDVVNVYLFGWCRVIF